MHTPGPWQAVDNGHYWEIKRVDSYHQIGDAGASKFLEHGDNGEANAHLMAAAPDLLKALEDLLAGYSAYAPNDGWPDKRQRQAIEAIAKARGKA